MYVSSSCCSVSRASRACLAVAARRGRRTPSVLVPYVLQKERGFTACAALPYCTVRGKHSSKQNYSKIVP